jgi:hypothetical protein
VGIVDREKEGEAPLLPSIKKWKQVPSPLGKEGQYLGDKIIVGDHNYSKWN